MVPSPFEGEATGLWGTVCNQKPGAGDLASAGTAIEVDVDVLGKVPNVVGSTVGEAEEALTAAGLLLATFADPFPSFSDRIPREAAITTDGDEHITMGQPPPTNR